MHGIPMPNTQLGKEEYEGVVGRAVSRAAQLAVKAAIPDSNKLALLHDNTTYGAQLNDWHNLDDIKRVARAKLSCLPEFGGDWGRAEHCECGARDTFAHAAMEDNGNCDRYRVTREAHRERL